MYIDSLNEKIGCGLTSQVTGNQQAKSQFNFTNTMFTFTIVLWLLVFGEPKQTTKYSFCNCHNNKEPQLCFDLISCSRQPQLSSTYYRLKWCNFNISRNYQRTAQTLLSQFQNFHFSQVSVIRSFAFQFSLTKIQLTR